MTPDPAESVPPDPREDWDQGEDHPPPDEAAVAWSRRAAGVLQSPHWSARIDAPDDAAWLKADQARRARKNRLQDELCAGVPYDELTPEAREDFDRAEDDLRRYANDRDLIARCNEDFAAPAAEEDAP